MHRLEYHKKSSREKRYILKKDIYNFCLKKIHPFFYPYVLKLVYKKKYNRSLSLETPKTISEKIQWLKINEKIEAKEILSDKITVKAFVRK